MATCICNVALLNNQRVVLWKWFTRSCLVRSQSGQEYPQPRKIHSRFQMFTLPAKTTSECNSSHEVFMPCQPV